MIVCGEPTLAFDNGSIIQTIQWMAVRPGIDIEPGRLEINPLLMLAHQHTWTR